jgi:hypothetical protein
LFLRLQLFSQGNQFIVLLIKLVSQVPEQVGDILRKRICIIPGEEVTFDRLMQTKYIYEHIRQNKMSGINKDQTN